MRSDTLDPERPVPVPSGPAGEQRPRLRVPGWFLTADGGLERRRCLGLTVLVVLVLYVAATLPAVAVQANGRDLDFHAKLADALLDGRLDIRPVPVELAELADPYDPAANESVRLPTTGDRVPLHDLAFHDGRLYSLHGPTQALLVNVPARLLGLPEPSNFLVTLLFVSLGFVGAIAIIGELRTRYAPELAVWAECSMVAAVGLASPAWWILTVGRGYESAIAVGYGLTWIGLALLLGATRTPGRPDRWLLGAGSFCLAAAVGARPHLAVAAAFLALAGVAVLHARRRNGALHGFGGDLAALLSPYVVVIGLLGAYNALRFGSPADFGTQFQLTYWNMQDYPLMQPRYALPNVYDYLVAPPRLSTRAPFLLLRESTSTQTPEFRRHFHEGIAGALLLYPVVPVGLAVGALNARRMWQRARPLAIVLALGVLLSAIVIAAISLPFNASTMRYTVDFVPALVLVAALGWGWSLTQYSGDGTAHKVLAGTWLLALAWSVAVGFALVLEPCAGAGTC